MDFLHDLFFTFIIAILLTFLIAHLAALSNAAGDGESPENLSESVLASSSDVPDDGEAKTGGSCAKDEAEIGGGVETERFCDVDAVGAVDWEDEWEGIERSGVEKLFGDAVDYVCSDRGVEVVKKLSSDVRMQLYGLRKVAVEGPCYETQPMVFKMNARAKWNAWQRLGGMNPDAAMEQYITILSDNIPGWMGEMPEGGVKKSNQTNSVAMDEGGTSDSGLSLQHEQHSATEISSSERDADTLVSDSRFKQGLTKTILLNLAFSIKIGIL